MGCMSSQREGSEEGGIGWVQGKELPGVAGVQDAGKVLMEAEIGQVGQVWTQGGP